MCESRRGYTHGVGLALVICRRVRSVSALLAIAGMVSLWGMALNVSAAGAQPGVTSLRGNTPGPVVHGAARLRGARGANATVSLNVDLATREPAQLEGLIQAASVPGTASYGHYLTPEQYRARFAPTSSEVRAAETWLRGQGLHVAGASPDNFLIHVSASTAAVERAFGVNINSYAAEGHEFYANDRNPSVPTSLHVDWISGLSNYTSFQAGSADHCVNAKKEPVFCGYFGSDFRTAYDLTGSGEGQTIGFTLWGKTVPQTDYTKYATDTGTTSLTVGGAGANGLEFVQVGGASTINAKDEVALDTEVAHAIAPGIHETYWLGATNTEATLETVLDDAATSKIPIISNSWGFSCASVPAGFEKILQAGVSTGKTFYFSSGDNGAESGTDCLGLSPQTVAVGGTELHVGPSSEWSSENALLDDGGCSNSQARPAWQTGIGSPLEWPSKPCSGRAIPDVSADSCYGGRETKTGETFGTECGAFVLVEGSIFEVGGTSLSAPLWAGASAVWNSANAAAGRPGIGFVAPLLYTLGNDPTAYANDFHDIQSGSNGFAATKGWDEATGWGSPNFNALENNAADITYTGPTSAVEGHSQVLSATLDDHGTTHGLEGKKVKFAVGAERCEATTSASGAASCSVTLHDAAGSYSVSAAFEGDVAYSAVSTSHTFTVQSGSPPAVTKLEPKEGPEAAGTQVTITGTNLTGAKEVKFGSTPAKSFKVESASTIIAEAPAGKGIVAVTVTTTAGTSTSTPADEYTYLTAPTVTTLPATQIKSGSASLNATVNPNGSEVTECRFEYGATMLLGSSAPCTGLPGSGTSAVEVSAPVTGLEANTTYYFRVLVRNAGGLGTGLEELFTTPTEAPSPPEFGRCLKAAVKGTGEYENAGCTKPGGTRNYSWYPAFGGAQPLAKTGFSTDIKALTELRLESPKQLITCKAQTGSGEYAGVHAVGNVVLTFTGCQHSGESCQSGAGEGEIKTQTLMGTLGVILASKEGPVKNQVGLDLRPVSASTIAEFSCGGTAVAITGAVITHVQANSMQLNTSLWTFTMSKGGKQTPASFEGGPKQTLQMKFGAGALEQAGVSLRTTLTNGEKVETDTVA
jgi:kumamolisin